MAINPEWRISDGSDGHVSVLADAMEGEAPDLTRGDEVTLTFLFYSGSRIDVDTGIAYGGELGGAYSGEFGGSYGGLVAAGVTNTASQFSGVGRYQTLRAYLDYAGTTRVGTSLNGVPYYRESIPDRAAVESHVLAFEPIADIDGMNGVWGVVVGGDDPSRNPPSMFELDVDVFILGDRAEYDGRSHVADEFEVTP